MKPVEFSGSNTTYAKDQPPYLPLPAYKGETVVGEVISCWRLTLRERFRLLFTGRIFWSQWTFNNPLQPQRPSLDFEPNGRPAG